MSATEASPTAIQVRDLTLSLQGDEARIDLFRSAQFFVDRGEIVAVMGPSGSGKTSLILALLGLLPVQGGSVTICGRDVLTSSQDELTELRRRHVGLVFSRPQLFGHLSSIDNVALPLRLNGVSRAEARARASDVLSLLSLDERGGQSARRLSTGEQQRVALARAVVHDPEVVIADEPTANLDEANAQLVCAVLQKASREDRAMLIATHDARVASIADRVLSVSHAEITGQVTR